MVDGATVETLKAITAAFNAHDLDAMMEFFAEDSSLDMPRGPEPSGLRLEGKAAVRAGLAALRGPPDVHYGEGRHWVSDDLGVSGWLLTGTNSNRQNVRVRGCDHWEFREGNVVLQGLVLEDRRRVDVAMNTRLQPRKATLRGNRPIRGRLRRRFDSSTAHPA